MAEADKDLGQEMPSPTPSAKPPKGGGKWKMFLLLLFLLLGGVTGVHMSGLVDVRPIIWSLVPKIPFVGEDLQKYLDIPKVYTLTAEERRKLELEQWQQRLDAREKEVMDKMSQAEAISNDAAARLQKLRQQEASMMNAQQNNDKSKQDVSAEEEATMKELIRTYQEISPRNAAQIVARLRDDLAVDLLRKLPQDARASILSKMDPKRAAAITEKLATP